MSKFVLQQISVYNYNSSNDKVKGTVKFKQSSTETEMQVNLDQEDVAKIFEVIADNIARKAAEAATSVLSDIQEMKQLTIEAKKPSEVITDAVDETSVGF